MAVTFESFLNTIIPPIVFLALGWWLFTLFKPMLGGLGGFFKGLWEKIKGEVKPERMTQKYISYE